MAENGTIDAHYRLLKEVSSKGTLSLKFSEDGKYLASASVDKTAKVWDTDTWEVKATLVGHQKGINDLAWTSCGNYIATASDDFTLRIWEANSGKCLRLIEGHTNYVFCCNFNPQGNMLISGSYDETLKVWNVRDGRCMRSIPAHSDPITSVSFSHDGTMILSSSFDGLVRLWDTDTGRCLKTIIDEPNPPVGIARFTPNSRYILIGTMASRIDLWDYEAQKKLKSYTVITTNKQPQIVVGSEDGSLLIFDTNSQQVAQKIEARQTLDASGEGHSELALAVSAHPGRPMFASGSFDGTIKIWEAKNV